MAKQRQYSFFYLPLASSEGDVQERRKLIAEGMPNYSDLEVKVSEVISRYAGDNGLSDIKVRFLTEGIIKVLNE